MSSPRSRRPTSTSRSSSRTSGTDGPLATPLIDRLRIDRLDPDRFVGRAGPGSHLFGGQLLGQGLLAAADTTGPDLRPQSLHAVFLAAGAGDQPVDYAVERLRDGTSFASRRVVGSQDGEPLVALTASFHRPEGEVLHQAALPDWIGEPGDGPTGRYHSPEFESRDIVRSSDDNDPLALAHWSRLQGHGPDDPIMTAAMIAWLSDNGSTRAARHPHREHPGFDRVRTTSLDHHLWFHQPADLDRWQITVLRSEATADARGLVRGTIHDDTGRHVASLAQEVLVRLPPSG
ncbi:MAG: acyl-CoA thioesterase domain-containing protein [Actinomycetota bacterium]